MSKKILSLPTSKLDRFSAIASETNMVIQNENMIIRQRSRYEYVNVFQAELVSKVTIQNINAVNIEITKNPTFSLGLIFEKIVVEHLLTLLIGFLFKMTYEFDLINILKQVQVLSLSFAMKCIVTVFTVVILYKLLSKILWYWKYSYRHNTLLKKLAKNEVIFERKLFRKLD